MYNLELNIGYLIGKKKYWHKSNKHPLKNKDLWQRLDKNLVLHHNSSIQWEWIKGHSGHPDNEYCHNLALNAAKSPLFFDTGYLSSSL